MARDMPFTTKPAKLLSRAEAEGIPGPVDPSAMRSQDARPAKAVLYGKAEAAALAERRAIEADPVRKANIEHLFGGVDAYLDALKPAPRGTMREAYEHFREQAAVAEVDPRAGLSPAARVVREMLIASREAI